MLVVLGVCFCSSLQDRGFWCDVIFIGEFLYLKQNFLLNICQAQKEAKFLLGAHSPAAIAANGDYSSWNHVDFLCPLIYEPSVFPFSILNLFFCDMSEAVWVYFYKNVGMSP